MRMIQRPLPNPERFSAIWNDHVYALKGSYTMTN
jgi:hypothetical protein